MSRFSKKRCAVALETSRLAVSRRSESRSFEFRLTRPRSWRLILLVNTDFWPNLTFFSSIRRFRIPLSVDLEIEKIRAIAEFAFFGFASLKRYINFAWSSDVRLPHVVADIDMIASLIKRLVPSLANFLKRSIGEPKKNGTHKYFTLQKRIDCKQDTETCQSFSLYVIKFSTKNDLNFQKKSRHLCQSFRSHFWCVKVVCLRRKDVKLNDWQAEFQRSKLFWNILLTNIWYFESTKIVVRSVFWFTK